jgi:hypothetical protein
MRGEMIGVWSETWREIWVPLTDSDEVANDIFCELYRELAKVLKAKPTIQELADIVDNPQQSQDAFKKTGTAEIMGESALVEFLEAVHPVLYEFGGDELSNHYFNLLAAFIDKYSLRYDLRRPCTLCPTLPGLLTNLVQQMRVTSQADAHLAKLNHEFEEALRDLRHGRTETRIKSYLTKQFILVEGIANSRNGTTGETLGQRCNQAPWPHPTLKAAAGNLYGFRSDYPGLGHAGNPKAVVRDLDDRELVGVSCMLLGVLPYVDSSITLNEVYGDSPPLSGTERTAHAASPTRPSTSVRLNRFATWVARLLKRD